MEAFNEYQYVDPENEEEQVFEDSFLDIERSSRADDCGGLPLPITGNLSELNKRINKLTQDPEDRFKRYVGAISHSITEKGLYNINIDDRNTMCRVASGLNNIKYLNATAYILGFLSTDGGKAIDDNKIKKIFKILNRLSDESVKPADVIRYARFWINLNITD